LEGFESIKFHTSKIQNKLETAKSAAIFIQNSHQEWFGDDI